MTTPTSFPALGARAIGLLFAGAIFALAAAPPTAAANSTETPRAEATGAASPLVLARADDIKDATGVEDERTNKRPEPRYQPREPEVKGWYNGSYVFGMTRGVAGSTMLPAAKVPLFVLTLPLDVALLPFALIGGLFG